MKIAIRTQKEEPQPRIRVYQPGVSTLGDALDFDARRCVTFANGKSQRASYLAVNLDIHKFREENQLDTVFLQKTPGHGNGFQGLVYRRGPYGLHSNVAPFSHDPGNCPGDFRCLG